MTDTKSPMSMALQQIQQNIIAVVEQLDIRSVLQLRGVNKALHQSIADDRVWTTLLLRDFGYYRKSQLCKDPYSQYKDSNLKRKITITSPQNYILVYKNKDVTYKRAYNSDTKRVGKYSGLPIKQELLFGQMCHLLRADPELSCRAVEALGRGDEKDVIPCFVGFRLFGDQFNETEEYELINFMETVLRVEFRALIQSFQGPRKFYKFLMKIMERRPGIQYYCRTIVEPIIDKCRNVNLELNPRKIAAQERDMTDAELRALITQRVQTIAQIVESITTSLESSVDKIPFAIRWICKCIYETTMDYAEALLLPVFLSNLVVNLIEPSFSFPLAAPLSAVGQSNCKMLGMLLQHFENPDNIADQPSHYRVLKDVIDANAERFCDFLRKVANVESISRKMMLGKYLYVKERKLITVSRAELYMVQDHLTKYIESSAKIPARDQPLRVVLQQLGTYKRCEDSSVSDLFTLELVDSNNNSRPESLYNDTKKLITEVSQLITLPNDLSVKALIQKMQKATLTTSQQGLTDKISAIVNNCNTLVKQGLLDDEDEYELLQQDLGKELKKHEEFVNSEYDNHSLLVQAWGYVKELNEYLIQQFPRQ